MLLARRQVPDASLEESSPDRLGERLNMAEAMETPATSAAAQPGTIGAHIVPAAQTIAMRADANPPAPPSGGQSLNGQSGNSPAQKFPAGGTVVLDVAEGRIEVPSFFGKNLRAAIEAAQEAGLDLEAIGSGVAREQSPQPGTRVVAGSRVVVKFGR
jgi:hypothetical protein